MIEIYADGADIDSILEMNEDPMISGFTTNPTLMRKAGVKNYEEFAKTILKEVRTKPISFEVLSDDAFEMEKQAIKIASWGENVYVKIPVLTTKGDINTFAMRRLALAGVKINATAITAESQIRNVITSLECETPSIISIFAGRIADTGVDPCYHIRFAKHRKYFTQKVLWASTREVFNYVQAIEAGADIITITPDILKKIKSLFGKDLYMVSLDTVKMFYQDALDSGFTL